MRICIRRAAQAGTANKKAEACAPAFLLVTTHGKHTHPWFLSFCPTKVKMRLPKQGIFKTICKARTCDRRGATLTTTFAVPKGEVPHL